MKKQINFEIEINDKAISEIVYNQAKEINSNPDNVPVTQENIDTAIQDSIDYAIGREILFKSLQEYGHAIKLIDEKNLISYYIKQTGLYDLYISYANFDGHINTVKAPSELFQFALMTKKYDWETILKRELLGKFPLATDNLFKTIYKKGLHNYFNNLNDTDNWLYTGKFLSYGYPLCIEGSPNLLRIVTLDNISVKKENPLYVMFNILWDVKNEQFIQCERLTITNELLEWVRKYMQAQEKKEE